MIIDLTHNTVRNCKGYAQDQMKIRGNVLSQHLPQSSVQNVTYQETYGKNRHLALHPNKVKRFQHLHFYKALQITPSTLYVATGKLSSIDIVWETFQT